MSQSEQFYQYDVEKMIIYLRGYCAGGDLNQSLRALSYIKKKDAGKFRKNGTPAIAHPLWMACYAAALEIRDDALMAIILLHDVCEDDGIPVTSLPFDERVQRGVRYMTISPLEGESKEETKKRYFQNMIKCPDALICKGIDRYANLSTMEGALDDQAIEKNVRETDDLLLPVLKQARDEYPEWANIFYVLRTNLRTINEILAHYHSVELTPGELETGE